MGNISQYPVEDIVAMRLEGVSCVQIAKHFNMPAPSVYSLLQARDVDTKAAKKIPRYLQVQPDVLKLRKLGYNTYKIAKKLGIQQQLVAKALKAAGVKLPHGLVSRFSKADVKEMARLNREGWDTRKLGEHFETTSGNISALMKACHYKAKKSTLSLAKQKCMLALYAQGLTGYAIATKMGIKPDRVYYWLEKYGIQARTIDDYPESRKRCNPKKIDLPLDELVRLYFERKWNASRIAHKFGVSTPTITDRLKAAGYELRRNHSGYRFTRTHKKTGRTVTFDSRWEFRAYNKLHRELRKSKCTILFQGEHSREFRAPTFVLTPVEWAPQRFTHSWTPDFVIPELRLIVEVKGHPRAMEKWECGTSVAIERSPALRGWKVHLWNEEDPASLSLPLLPNSRIAA
jgi:transposase-like protein